MKKNSIKFFYLQISIFIFALSNVFFKFASVAMATKGLFSIACIFYIGAGILALGIHAIFWQQVLKYFELNVANAIKVSYLLWGTLFSIFIFKENYKISNFIGLLLIMLGIILIIHKNQQKKGEAYE